jgi:cytochrome c-type biogenesis protein CcmH/NrfG
LVTRQTACTPAPEQLGDLRERAFEEAGSGSFDRARRTLERLAPACPTDARLFLRLGDARRRSGRLEEAIPAWLHAAKLFLDQGDLRKASAACAAALYHAPGHHEARQIHLQARRLALRAGLRPRPAPEHRSIGEVGAIELEGYGA